MQNKSAAVTLLSSHHYDTCSAQLTLAWVGVVLELWGHCGSWSLYWTGTDSCFQRMTHHIFHAFGLNQRILSHMQGCCTGFVWDSANVCLAIEFRFQPILKEPHCVCLTCDKAVGILWLLIGHYNEVSININTHPRYPFSCFQLNECSSYKLKLG